MSNAAVTSVLARCLLDADFLERMDANPRAALKPYVLDKCTRAELAYLDIARVRRFAGFITKVQHNFLWESFPYTVKLLKYYGIELELFAAYLGHHQRLRHTTGVGKGEKISAFVGFLHDFLIAHPESSWPGLLDVLHHEQAEWEVRAAGGGGEPAAETLMRTLPASGGSNELLRLVPVVRGVLRVARYAWDPCAVIALLARGEFSSHRLKPRPHCLAYWGDVVSQELRVLEIDPVSASLLEQVDGRRSLRAVIRRGCADRLAPGLPAIRRLFGSLADHGVLAFAGARS